MTLHHRQHESGNALWFILLAIALLVALTVTITRTSETTEETGSRDRNSILASDILRQARSMEQAVEKLRLTGSGENNLSFQTSFVSDYTNPRCTTDSCRLFETASGAGMTYKPPLSAWLDPDFASETEPPYGEWYFYGRACIPGVGEGDSGCNSDDENAELIMALPWIRQDLCMEINRMVGVTNPGTPPGPPPLSAAAYPSTLDQFRGVFEASAEITHANLDGHKTGCFAGGGSDPDGGFHFYHVLLAR